MHGLRRLLGQAADIQDEFFGLLDALDGHTAVPRTVDNSVSNKMA
jgi:hypothetical protein